MGARRPIRGSGTSSASTGRSDIAQARRLLVRYGVRYVFVGSLERHDYPPDALAKFRRLGRAVFSHDGTVVYRVPQSGGRSSSARPS